MNESVNKMVNADSYSENEKESTKRIRRINGEYQQNFGHLSTPFIQNDKKILSEVYISAKTSKMKVLPLNHLNLIIYFVCKITYTIHIHIV